MLVLWILSFVYLYERINCNATRLFLPSTIYAIRLIVHINFGFHFAFGVFSIIIKINGFHTDRLLLLRCVLSPMNRHDFRCSVSAQWAEWAERLTERDREQTRETDPNQITFHWNIMSIVFVCDSCIFTVNLHTNDHGNGMAMAWHGFHVYRHFQHRNKSHKQNISHLNTQ